MKIWLVGSLPPYKDGIADHNYSLFSNLLSLDKENINIIPSIKEKLTYPQEFSKNIRINPEDIAYGNDELFHLQFGNSYPNSFVFRIFNKIKNTKSKIVVAFHDTTNTNIAKILRTIKSDPKKLFYEFNKPTIKD